MDKNEAIEILRKGYPDINRYAASELEAYEYDVETYNEAVGYAISHLEADRWIPVSEKLPEKDGRFLICTSSGDIDTNAFVFGQFTRPYVVVWKHLPEPYDWRTENEC